MPDNRLARKAAAMGLLTALTAALNFAEGLIPALPMLPPGVKLGLANIVVAYALFYLDSGSAFALALLKSGFVLLTRGLSAGWMSLAGGLLSLGVMALARRCFSQEPRRYYLVSVPGAVSHNLGQLCAAAALLKSWAVFYSLPFLVLSGILMGYVTAALLRVALPALKRTAPARKINDVNHFRKD